MTIIKSIWICFKGRLQAIISLLHYGIGGSLLSWLTIWFWIFAVRTYETLIILIGIIVVFLFTIPAFFADDWITGLFIFLRIVFEKCIWCRRLWLIMVASISIGIFTLIEFIICVKVLFKWLANLCILVTHDIGISNILRMNAWSTFNQRQCLSMHVLIRIRCKTTTSRFLGVLVVITWSA